VLSERRPGDQLVYVTDYQKLHRHTGWKPEVSVRETLEMLYQFWDENRKILGARLPQVEEPTPFPVSAELYGRAG
jgi:dTDP-D-glucose 4,6-dehydratase